MMRNLKSKQIIKALTILIAMTSIICPPGSFYLYSHSVGSRIVKIENNDNMCSLFFTTINREPMIRVLSYCDSVNLYSRNIFPVETSINSNFPSKVLTSIYDFCIIDGLKFFVVGRASSGVGSTMDGVVAIWHWHRGFD